MAPTIAKVAVALIVFVNATLAFQFRQRAKDIAITAGFLQHHDAESAQINPVYTLSEAKINFLEIVQNAKQLPSCQKVASAALMHSCSILEPTVSRTESKPPSVDLLISEATRAYAARLAVCELQEGGSKSLPEACHSFVPTEASTKRRTMAGHLNADSFSKPIELYLDYDDATSADLDRCIAALKETPQSWTSYSNSKQNAVVICRAISDELRKEKTIDLYEQLVKSSAELGKMFQAMPHEVQAFYEEVKADIKQFWLDLYAHDAKKRSEIDELWNALESKMRTDVGGILERFQEAMSQLQQQSAEATETNVAALQHAFNEASAGMKAVSVQHDNFAATQLETLEYFNAVFQTEIVQVIGNATTGLANQQELMNANNQYLLQFGTSLAKMIMQLDSVESRLAATEVSLKIMQEEAQRTAANLHESAERTEAVLNRTRQDAMALQETLDSIATFFGIGLTDTLKSLAFFIVAAVTAGLGSFAFWHGKIGLSLLGAISASLASALALAFITTIYLLPAIEVAATLAIEQVYPVAKSHEVRTLFHALAGLVTLCVAAIVAVHYAAKKKRESAPYDPASPPLTLRKWTV